jgi:hypothetical protein
MNMDLQDVAFVNHMLWVAVVEALDQAGLLTKREVQDMLARTQELALSQDLKLSPVALAKLEEAKRYLRSKEPI